MLDIFKRNTSYKQGSSIDYQSNVFGDLHSIQSEMLWFSSRTDQVPMLFRFLSFYVNDVIKNVKALYKKHLSFHSHQYYISCELKNNKILVAQIPQVIK